MKTTMVAARRPAAVAASLVTAASLVLSGSLTTSGAAAEGPGDVALAVVEVTASEVVLDLDVPGAEGRTPSSADLRWEGFDVFATGTRLHTRTAALQCVADAACTTRIRVPRNDFVNGTTTIRAEVTGQGISTVLPAMTTVEAGPRRPEAALAYEFGCCSLAESAMVRVTAPARVPEKPEVRTVRAYVSEDHPTLSRSPRLLWQSQVPPGEARPGHVREVSSSTIFTAYGSRPTLIGVVTDEHGIESAFRAGVSSAATASDAERGSYHEGVFTDSRGNRLPESPWNAVGDPQRGATVSLRVSLPAGLVPDDELDRVEVVAPDGTLFATRKITGRAATVQVPLPPHAAGGLRTVRVRAVTQGGGVGLDNVRYRLGGVAKTTVRVGKGLKDGAVVMAGKPLTVRVDSRAALAADQVRLLSLTVDGKRPDLLHPPTEKNQCAPFAPDEAWLRCTSRTTADFVFTPRSRHLGRTVTVAGVAETPAGGRKVFEQTVKVRSSMRLAVRPTHTKVERGVRLTVRGHASKAHTLTPLKRHRAVLQFRASGSKKWRTVATDRSDRKGALAATVTAQRTGSYRWVVPAIGKRYVRSVSPSAKVRVR